ncbi:glycosyltransferase family 4 protein [Spirulina sp. CS-785/01]|uniref:glycosyltransferase family 4 protein n=1 Tax=Spirulina sp. CS-785/01 TaxID=3021716 RepID=UPI00232C0E17|nr:glycosyltransferase family 4 protein [Spirulina sp. CS-785/01]MDB9315909.1 glycosyltransferase family 4 protein [Spirulina sp. CS-785/01]
MVHPLIISTSDIDGGAAKASYRLHRGLQSIDVPSQMLVRAKFSGDSTVVANKTPIARLGSQFDHLPLRFYPQRDRAMFSCQWFPDRITPAIAQLQPDILNLHWINNGYLQLETLPKLKKTMVWTLHDMWGFTGGCHYSRDCDRYTQNCGHCPHLQSNSAWDVSRWIWQRKAKIFPQLNLTIVTPSHWLAKCAQTSPLLAETPVKVIPNGIDTQVYKPITRSLVRQILNLPTNKKLILFGAMGATRDPRKGFSYLQEALQKLSYTTHSDSIELLIFGASQPTNPPQLGFSTRYLGRFQDDLSLALVYAAADVFVVPSTQENLSNTVMEAIACGTPCVAFGIGGMSDMIEHKQNGYLAQPYETEDLAQGIGWVLADEQRHAQLGDRARTKTEQEFTLQHQARQYQQLFTEILARSC